MNTSKKLRSAVCAVLWVAGAMATMVQSASAGVIGSFSSARPGLYGSLFDVYGSGSLVNSAHNALVADGHTFVALDGDISAASLSAIDLVYLPLSSSSNGPQVLSAAEVAALNSFVSGGGHLIVQSDYGGYANLLSSYGVTRSNNFSTPGTVAITTSYAPLTNGPYGTVSSMYTAAAATFDLPVDGIYLDDTHVVGVLAGGLGLPAGSGTAIFLGDINMFDDPENANGYASANDATLWRNMFALADTVQHSVPEPATLVLVLAGLAAAGVGRRRSIL